MKPVAIFRHAAIEGPGYFATYLERNRIPWRLVKVDEGEPVPENPREFSGLAFMGGPMSVNDDRAWIAPVLRLIRAAVEADVPVLGHCLGGQLMARALGGEVTRNAVKEIGWGRVDVAEAPAASAWFGARTESFNAFHWHGETFSIPPGAARIASTPHCANQAFALGKSLGMQCHVEMTRELVESWCKSGAREIARNLPKSPAVQPVEEITRELDARLEALHRVADRVYERWIAGLRRG
ncbi:MAG: type 1 glutamine amidotransferase [Betaproteobacteria bacterium]|nr:type 1 glutamine amidotransferase [Betaproteobacteria bacterium]